MSAKKPPRKRSRMPFPTEHEEAVILCQWMSLRGLFYFHCTSEAKRSYGLARYLQAEGMVSGVPDYIILSHPKNAFGVAEYDGISPPVFLELKRKGGRLSPSQEAFLARLQAEGYATIVAYGADEAIEELTKIGY